MQACTRAAWPRQLSWYGRIEWLCWVNCANEGMGPANKSLAESGEIKIAAEGDLAVAIKAINEDVTAFAGLHQDCMAKTAWVTNQMFVRP